MKHVLFSLFLLCVRGHDIVPVTVTEGDSVTLSIMDIETIQQEEIRWYFNSFCFADTTGDQNSTDVQCVNDTEIFRNRLKVNNMTGTLTITDTRTTDSGLYKLQISNSSSSHLQVFRVSVYNASQQDKTKSVKEGDSFILDPGVVNATNYLMKWIFDGIPIAEISGDLSFNCTDVQCNNGTERFRNRLKLDQTLSLTIMNTRTTDSGDYKLQIISKRFSIMKSFIVNVTGYAEAERVSVVEGDSVTLYSDVETIQQEKLKWYFNEIQITGITRDSNETCTSVQCKERLKVNHQTGSLTITNISTTDSGLYKLQISSDSLQLFSVSVFYAPEQDKLKTKSVKEGESVILYPGVVNTTNYSMKWIFNDVRIAEINGDLGFNCTDVQCNNGTERYRNRLKLDHQTLSLTIMNTTTTDSGVYQLQINNKRLSIIRSFIIKITGVSAERDEMKKMSVKEGESVTLDNVEIKKTKNMMKWYFKDTLIAEITGDQSQICRDEECKKRFRDRLKLDHQTGSLTIMNIKTTDSGLYKLQISDSSRINIIKSFTITVHKIEHIPDVPAKELAVSESVLPPAAVAGICVGVAVLLLVVAGVMYYRKHQAEQSSLTLHFNNQMNGTEDPVDDSCQ